MIYDKILMVSEGAATAVAELAERDQVSKTIAADRLVMRGHVSFTEEAAAMTRLEISPFGLDKIDQLTAAVDKAEAEADSLRRELAAALTEVEALREERVQLRGTVEALNAELTAAVAGEAQAEAKRAAKSRPEGKV